MSELNGDLNETELLEHLDALAIEHAERADALLRALEAAEEELARIAEDPRRELELIAGGVVKRLNANRDWTADLARAHALASIAAALAARGA